MASECTARREGAALVVTFGNPPSGLATAGLAARICDIIAAASDDADVAAIVLAGIQPGVFVRHYDVGSLARAAEALRAGTASREDFVDAPFARLTDLIAASPKPVIAAIEGLCMGGGFELALACDIRVAGRTVTRIGLPEMRIGIFPGCGGTQRLPRLIGEARALDFILRGAVVDAPEALALGLVHAVSDDPLGWALDYVAHLATRNPAAVACAKHLVRSALCQPLDDGLRQERLAFGDLLGSDALALETMHAFVASGDDLGARA